MATVRSKEIRLFTGETWIQKVTFKIRDGKFYIAMPLEYTQAFANPVGDQRIKLLEVSGKNIAEVDKAFDEAIARWKSVDTKERKVLAYVFYLNSDVKIKKKDRWGDTSVDYEREDLGMIDVKLGIAFDYEVCIEATTGGKKFYFNRIKNPSYDPKSSREVYHKGNHYQAKDEWIKEQAEIGHRAEDPKDWEKHTAHVIIVDWSQEREDFLAQLKARMRRLVKQAMEFERMTQDQKGLDNIILQMLNGGQNLLALPPAEKEQSDEQGTGKAVRRKE